MKTDIFKVTNDGTGWDQAMDEAEHCGTYCGLAKNDSLRLRLMTEEILSLMKSTVGKFSGNYWIEKDETNTFKIHLQSDVFVNIDQRDELMSAAKSSGNKKKNIFETIKSVWSDYLDAQSVILSDPNSQIHVNIMGMDVSASGLPMYSWSLNNYIENLPANESEKDELEKFILKSIADDLLVSVRKNYAELTVTKKFSK
ncbi:MAG: hypothetical protein K5894_03780 [Lachnospiraceae bacterium]|nr:hypothetical protein [Lachnospiraceae bacterium]MDN4742733.1 hypothetical protein [Lachnospiraceae bacterium C1.1]